MTRTRKTGAIRQKDGTVRAAISVVIPCHNDADYIGEALDSVFQQSCMPSEVIVVDDGSTDDSAKVVKRHDPRIKLIAQSNQGISGARNAGLAAATGAFIAFLDADDLWTPDSLEARLTLLVQNPALDCAFGLVEQFLSPDLSAEARARLHCPEGQTAARFAGAMLIRRTVLTGLGGFDLSLRVGETIDLVARLNDAGTPCGTAQRLVMRRRIHGRNTVIEQRSSQADYLRALKASLDRRAAQRHAVGL